MPDQLRLMYEQMSSLRLFEERISSLFDQARLPRHSHLSLGQEAVAAGVCGALRETDIIVTTHRSHAHALAKGSDMYAMMAEILGRTDGLCGGRAGSMHLADVEHGVLASSPIVGGGLPIAVGAALAAKMKGTDEVVVCFFGDGAVNQGTFSESLNMAALWRLPVVFVCENNGYSQFVPMSAVTSGTIVGRARCYGIEARTVDGNDAVEVRSAAEAYVRRARELREPSFLECLTYRSAGHSTSDRATYRPEDEVREWKARDPLVVARTRLALADDSFAEWDRDLQQRLARDVEDAAVRALACPLPDPPDAGVDVLSDSGTATASRVKLGQAAEMTFREAIRAAIRRELRDRDDVFLIGECVGYGGGAYKVAEGLVEEFGHGRVIEAPISENSYVGCSAGAAMRGMRPICEIMFADLFGLAIDQIFHVVGQSRYITGGQVTVPLVIRASYGAGGSAGATHSQSWEGILGRVPGIRIVVPSTPQDAYTLLRWSVASDDPVVFLEHRSLYNIRGKVDPGIQESSPRSVRPVTAGEDLTVVAYGPWVHRAQRILGEWSQQTGLSADLLDLRIVAPLELDAVFESVRRTGRLILISEEGRFGGVGAELLRQVYSECFSDLKVACRNLCPPLSPVPFSPSLEAAYLPSDALIRSTIEAVMS